MVTTTASKDEMSAAPAGSAVLTDAGMRFVKNTDSNKGAARWTNEEGRWLTTAQLAHRGGATWAPEEQKPSSVAVAASDLNDPAVAAAVDAWAAASLQGGPYRFMRTQEDADHTRHGEHIWEPWNASLSDPENFPEWVNDAHAGMCCHTCHTVYVDNDAPLSQVTSCAFPDCIHHRIGAAR